MPTISVPLIAGQRTKVYSVFSDSLPRTIAFDVATRDGAPPDGVIEVQSRQMLLIPKTEQRPLAATNTVIKSWVQSPFAIYVTASTDADLRLAKAPAGGRTWLLALAIVGIALAALLPMLLQ